MATRLLYSAHRGSTLRSTSSSMTPTPSTSPNRQRRRPPRHDAPASGEPSSATHHARPSRHPQAQGQRSTPRPTHFLALPIGHHAHLRSTVQALTASWLAHDPPIDELDPSIVVQPRRLHLTLGVMALAPSPPSRAAVDPAAEPETERDLAAAARLLADLAPRIRAILARAPLRVPLGRLTVMQPDPTRAHVLYAEPDISSPDGRRLRTVCELIRNAFMEAGFLAADRRPLKLHCTLLNTNYRRPVPGQRRAAGRVPFDFTTFPSAARENSNLGTWTVDELQICEMGSWAPDGAYVRVAGCDLRPEKS
ncbi:AKAP7 2'5' RNA ligase-like domain-containing protein [Lactarius akahatsu]|uniref:AKAP7 2'5' RNA ligase-like domain-containing protein n=1 Tax=Lactarius akahatsu TaxID=416441 RepID=A0AAD4QCR1_9AGAM|nr:AKAP7 2'5' RNA ligase-like domain-containing protein [Lactarius akahatsu]